MNFLPVQFSSNCCYFLSLRPTSLFSITVSLRFIPLQGADKTLSFVYSDLFCILARQRQNQNNLSVTAASISPHIISS